MTKRQATDVLRVDFVSDETLRLPGRLGLTMAPGRKDLGPGHLRNLEGDLATIKALGADVLVSLLDEGELQLLGIPGLHDAARAAGLESISFPITDYGIPSSMPAFLELIRTVSSRLAKGRTVVVHCRMGIGRTAVVCGACLIASGWSVSEAIETIRTTRPMTLLLAEHRRFLSDFAKDWNDASR